MVVDGQSCNAAAVADALLARDYRDACRDNNICDRLSAGSGGVIGRNIDNVAAGSSLLGNRRNIVRVGERELGAGVAQLLKQRLDGVDLVLGVRLSRAVQQTYILRVREQLLEHIGLTVERCEVGGAGDVGAGLAGPVGDAQGGAVVGNRGAENRNIRGSRLRCLKRCGRVCHDEVIVRGNKAVYDGRAVRRLAGSVLEVELDLAAVRLDQLGQLVLEALRCRVERLVLNQLYDTDLVAAGLCGVAAGSRIAVIAAGSAAAAAAGRHRQCHSACHQRRE